MSQSTNVAQATNPFWISQIFSNFHKKITSSALCDSMLGDLTSFVKARNGVERSMDVLGNKSGMTPYRCPLAAEPDFRLLPLRVSKGDTSREDSEASLPLDPEPIIISAATRVCWTFYLVSTIRFCRNFEFTYFPVLTIIGRETNSAYTQFFFLTVGSCDKWQKSKLSILIREEVLNYKRFNTIFHCLSNKTNEVIKSIKTETIHQALKLLSPYETVDFCSTNHYYYDGDLHCHSPQSKNIFH